MSEHETTPPTSPDPADVGLRFLTVAHQVRTAVDQHMAAAGLSLARTKLLRLLARRGALHQAELAEALGQAPRSVTQAVEALERLRLVTRAPDPVDRRRKTVTLTEQGHAALAAGEQAGTRILQRIFGALDTRQLTRLEQLLTDTDEATRHGAAGDRHH
ncbi:MarR family winged helix-turn-helix transcriptional regulator [Streptomyces olivaceoviridis]|uniref:MarR family winged helix-turn-helix transcriptional regulator n=1 Tax=Streptomyces olivaceoviridis TaxID=1921 RepID=UPI000B0DDF20